MPAFLAKRTNALLLNIRNRFHQKYAGQHPKDQYNTECYRDNGANNSRNQILITGQGASRMIEDAPLGSRPNVFCITLRPITIRSA